MIYMEANSPDPGRGSVHLSDAILLFFFFFLAPFLFVAGYLERFQRK